MPKRSSVRTPRALISAIVDSRLQPPDFAELIGAGPSADLWLELVDAMLSANPARAEVVQLGRDQGLDIEDRINAALPPDLRHAAFLYHEGIEAERQMETLAAYELGVAVGRRLGGAR